MNDIEVMTYKAYYAMAMVTDVNTYRNLLKAQMLGNLQL